MRAQAGGFRGASLLLLVLLMILCRMGHALEETGEVDWAQEFLNFHPTDNLDDMSMLTRFDKAFPKEKALEKVLELCRQADAMTPAEAARLDAKKPHISTRAGKVIARAGPPPIRLKTIALYRMEVQPYWSDEAEQYVRACIEAPDGRVRKSAANVLLNKAPVRNADLINGLLHDSDDDVRGVALGWIYCMPDRERRLRELVKELEKQGENEETSPLLKAAKFGLQAILDGKPELLPSILHPETPKASPLPYSNSASSKTVLPRHRWPLVVALAAGLVILGALACWSFRRRRASK